ncbi:MAG: hypothetical protein JW739_02160 [Opitutales bacterium]|nr:hypothetical protein [Opitutales bacterium]
MNETQLTYVTCKSLLNQGFEVRFPEPPPELKAANAVLNPPPVNLTLREVTEKNNEDVEGFSLIFHSKENHLLPQNTYQLHNDTLGSMNIFLVPVGEKVDGEGADRKVTGYIYQSIFNALKKKERV